LLLVAKLVTTGCSDVKDGRLSGQMCLQALSDDHKRFCRLPDLDDECEMRMRGWFVVVVKGSERGEGGSPHGTADYRTCRIPSRVDITEDNCRSFIETSAAIHDYMVDLEYPANRPELSKYSL
jgi:hypothetical protein